MILPETPDFFQITCDSRTKIAELRWEYCPDFHSFQENYQQLVQFMLAQELNCALLDVRERGAVPYANQSWLCQEIFPTLITQIKKTVKLAYVVNASYYQALQAESPNGDMETYGDLIKMQFFLDDSVARQWLQAI